MAPSVGFSQPWRWVMPWGWSWVDDAAWGFAPSHYGRWASIPETDSLDPSAPGPERWGWVPGDRVVITAGVDATPV
jgi:hypothetical protein